MAVDVTVEAVIHRPVDVVAAYSGDPSNAPRWYRRIASARWRTDPPARLGSRITFEARFLGRDLVYTYEITELVPGARLMMQTAEGPFPMTTTYEWRPSGAGSTFMTLRNHGEPSGVVRLMGPIVSLAMRRSMRQDLEALRRTLEAD